MFSGLQVYVHWPVQTPLDGGTSEGPPAHILAYRTLEEMCLEGKIKAVGLSNYRISDYEDLLSAGPMKGALASISSNRQGALKLRSLNPNAPLPFFVFYTSSSSCGVSN